MSDLLVKTSAIISDCEAYRYRLAREWDSGPRAVFVMLNPSTADATQDDPTIRRCISFAKREGCGSLDVVNLFAFRATSPADMKSAADPVGPENDRHIMDAFDNADGPIICAWGAHGAYRGRDREVAHLIDAPLQCFGLTKAGAPKHPLYLPADAPLVLL